MISKNYVEGLCSKCVKIVLEDLITNKLINLDSELELRYYKRIYSLCIKTLFSILDFIDVSEEYLIGNTLLFTYSFFLDSGLDLLEDEEFRKVENIQASSYLLLKYKKFIDLNYSKDLEKVFYEFFIQQSQYLSMEKQYISEEIANNYYIVKNDLIEKVKILTFPLILLKDKCTSFELNEISEFYRNYYSFILSIDDIMDFEFDINNNCITYPIAVYYSKFKKSPDKEECLNHIYSDLIQSINIYRSKIYNKAKDGRYGICLKSIEIMQMKINHIHSFK